MAVEYEISSDVATIKGVATNTQLAKIVSVYTGSVTYDDEPTSKYANVTIDGKTQRVMLCIAVSGTVTYDDTPSLYSTVDGHRCLNILESSATETPDFVPNIQTTLSISGKNYPATRCVLINKTPTYDGMSNTCTFTDDDGKIHSAQLVNSIDGQYEIATIRGQSPLSLPDAVADELIYVKAFGLAEQFVEPTPDSPTGILCNNGGIGIDSQGNITVSGNTETIKDSKNNTVTCEMLLGMSSYRDEQEILTGAIVRRIGIKVLDGTEDWVEKTANTITWYEADILDNNMFKQLICTHFLNQAVVLNNNAVYKSAGESVLQVRYDDAGSLANFKQWLADQYSAGTPVMLTYVLATPTTESVTGQTLEVKSGANTIQITDASLSDLLLEAQYKKTV